MLVVLHFCALTNRRCYVQCLLSHLQHESCSVTARFLNKSLTCKHIPLLEEKHRRQILHWGEPMELLNYNNDATKSVLPPQEKNGVLVSFVGRKIGIWGYFIYEVQSAERQLTKQFKGGLSHTRGTSWSGCPRFILFKIQSEFQ